MGTGPDSLPRRLWARTVRVVRRLKAHQIGVLSAGVAYYAFFGLFPMVGAALSIYGLVLPARAPPGAGPASTGLLPTDRAWWREQMAHLPMPSERALGAGAVLAFALVIWSASRGARGLIRALDLAYEVHEKHGFIRIRARALVITFAGILMLVMGAVFAIAASDLVRSLFGLSTAAAHLAGILRWPVFVLGLLGSLLCVYRFGPYHRRGPWAGYLSGALVALLVWLLGSWGLSVYLRSVANLNRTFGALSTVAALLLWLQLAAWAVLLGAEVNADSEAS
jgi:membrane protein